MPHPSVHPVQKQVRTSIHKLYNFLDARNSLHMETPAHTPDTSVPSETIQDPAVSPELASTVEAVDGMQSLPDDIMDPDNWEKQLAILDAQQAAEKNGTAPVAESTTPAAAAPPVETDPAAGLAAEADAATEQGDEKYGPQHRIRPRSETDAAVLKLLSRNADMTLAEAMAKVTGTAPTEAAAQAEAAVPATVAAASALDALTARQEALKQELQAAYAEMDFEKVGTLQTEALDLMEKKTSATAAKAQAEALENAAFDAKVAQAEAEVRRLYPTADAPNSALNARMTAIYDSMKATNDPTLESPDLALKLAQMAAGQLNIGPAVATPAPAPAAQAAPPRAPLVQVRPAAGGQVSGAVTAPAADALLSGSENWSPEQWEVFNEKHLGIR